MKSRIDMQATSALLLLALILVPTAGCENTDLTAPDDATLVVTANPTQVLVDEESGRGRSVIRGELRDVDGIPLESTTVTFSVPSGSLIDNTCEGGACSSNGDPCTTDVDCPLSPPGSQSDKTNSKGRAEVTLVVTATDDESIVVTGTSGGLADTAVVFNSLGVTDDPPTASINVFPSSPALAGGPVDLDGTGSFDPDGDAITCYQWEITSSIPVEVNTIPCATPSVFCDVIQGPTEEFPTLSYFNEQRLSITLRVSDDPDALPCSRSGPLVDRSLFGPPDQVNPYYLCNNAKPLASLVADPGPHSLPFAGTVDVAVDASGSTDSEGGTLTYSWSCGSGAVATPPNTTMGVCSYNTVGFKTITVIVTDPGNGQSSCAKSASAEAQIQVVAAAP